MIALSKIACFLVVCALHAATGGVITTNTLGEYFDPVANSAERYIYGQLTVTEASATLLVYPPPITTNGVQETVLSEGLARISIQSTSVTKTLAQIQIDKQMSANLEITAIPNQAAVPGYKLTLQLLGQVLNTNIFSTPNPVQYFLLQMFPITAGITQPVFCDFYYQNQATKKWILPSENNFISQGLFLSQTWKTNLIAEVTTNDRSTVSFTLQIPATSFVNLQQGTYQIRIAAVMAPLASLSGQPAVQAGSLTKLVNSAFGLAFDSNSINAATNIVYLQNQIVEVVTANDTP